MWKSLILKITRQLTACDWITFLIDLVVRYSFRSNLIWLDLQNSQQYIRWLVQYIIIIYLLTNFGRSVTVWPVIGLKQPLYLGVLKMLSAVLLESGFQHVYSHVSVNRRLSQNRRQVLALSLVYPLGRRWDLGPRPMRPWAHVLGTQLNRKTEYSLRSCLFY